MDSKDRWEGELIGNESRVRAEEETHISDVVYLARG